MQFLKHPAFRWLLSILLLCLIGYQLWLRSDQIHSFRINDIRHAGWYLAAVLVLMPVNWWLEALKWHGFLSVHSNIPFQRSFKAVTGGIALSLFTPNRIGEYGGRLLFMPYAIRWPVVFSRLMSSISQNLIAYSAGVIALIFLFDSFIFIKVTGIISILLAAFCFFRMRKVVDWICRRKLHPAFIKLANQLSHLSDYKSPLLGRSLWISLLRYVVYTSQFVLLLHAFEPQIPFGILYMGVSALYLFQTLVPMPPVTDVLARTNLALILWSGTGMSELSISLASFIVWMINLLVPAILGSLAIGTIAPKKSFSIHDSDFSPSYEPVVADQPKIN